MGLDIGTLLGAPSVGRAIEQHTNRQCTNQIPDSGTLIDAYHKGLPETTFRRAMKSQGYSDAAIDIMELSAKSIQSPGDLFALRQKGLITDEQLKAGLKANGYSDAAADSFLDAKLAPPTPAQALEMKRKGVISEEELRKNLKANGMSDAAIDAYIETSDFHFSPEDQAKIDKRARMSSETLHSLGIDTEPSDEFMATCKRQGMTDDQARAAWLNLQPLPAANEIADLLHRGSISDETARDALRGMGLSDSQIALALKSAENVIPFRSAGTMFMNDGMSSDDLYQNLLQNGYSEDDAKKLVAYYEDQKAIKDAKAAETKTKAATAAKTSSGKAASSATKAVKDKDIALSLIKQAYYYKEATPEEAKGLIMSLDYEDWEAELTLAIWNAQLTAKDQQDAVDLIELKFKNGIIKEADVRHELGSLGIKGVVIDTIILKNTKIKSANTKHPSEAKLQTWLKKGIIDTNAFIDQMTILGYSIEDIANFYQEAGGVLE